MKLTIQAWCRILAIAALSLPLGSSTLPTLARQSQPKKEAWYLYKPLSLTSIKDIKGKVRSVRVTQSKVVMKFGEPKPGSDIVVEYYEFDSNGLIKLEENTEYVNRFSEEPFDEPSITRHTYSFDFGKRRIIVNSQSQWKSGSGKRYWKRIEQFDEQGDEVESTIYDMDGSVTSKSVSQKIGDKRYSRHYDKDGKLTFLFVTYPGGTGKSIEESHWGDKTTSIYVVEDLPGGTKQRTEYDGTGTKLKGRSVWTESADGLYTTFERYNANGSLEVRMKTKRTIDRYGNWDTEVELEEVHKFGKTYFEPISITVRTIKYWTEDEQPAKRNERRRQP